MGVNEIESAIAKLSRSEVDELAAWLDSFRARRTGSFDYEAWLKRAKGAGVPGVTTDQIMQMTRGEE